VELAPARRARRVPAHTGQPFAAETAAAVERTLDGYAARWAKAHADACAATRLRGVQSEALLEARMDCLDARRRELAALVDVFAQIDASHLEKAAPASERLRDVGACANLPQLRLRPPMPVEPAARAEMVAIRDQMARATALHLAGKPREAMPLAESAAQRAEKLAYAPLVAEATFALGKLQAVAEVERAAEETLHRAAVAAEASRHDEIAARSFAALARLLGGAQTRRREAARSAALAEAALHRAGGDPSIEAELLLAKALVGLFEEPRPAIEELRRAVELVRRLPGEGGARVAELESVLATALGEAGRYTEGLVVLKDAAAVAKRALGAAHPLRVTILQNLSITLRRLGRIADAVAAAQRAVVITEGAYGPEHVRTGRALNVLAQSLYAGAGRYREALPHARRALAILEKSFPPTHRRLQIAIESVGNILFGLERWQEALEYHRRLLAIREEVYGPKHASVGHSLNNLANCEQHLGRFEEARVHVLRALEAGGRADYVSNRWHTLGNLYLLQRRWREAIAPYERSLALIEPVLAPTDP
jgi:hypothetical protein